MTNPSNSSTGSIIYNVTPTSTAGSCIGNSTAITVTINPRPAVFNSSTATICSGTSPNITLAASTTSTFAWTLGTNIGSITGASASNGSSINQTLTNPSNSSPGSIIYNVTPTSTIGSCTGSVFPITIVINPKPTFTYSTTNSNTICSGTNTNISLTPSIASNFNWSLGTNTGGIIGASANNGTLINQTLYNLSSNSIGSIIYFVKLISIAHSCWGDSIPISVIVNPRPINNGTSSQTICSGTASSVSLTANTTGGTNTFAFTTSSVTGLSGNANGSGSSIAQTLSTTNTSPTNAVYLVTPTFNYNSVACVGIAYNDTVTVNPRPVNYGTSTQTICSGIASNVSLTANTTGGTNSFAWTSSAVGGISGNSNSNGSTIAQTLSTTNTSPTNVNYSVIPTYTFNSVGCAGTAATVIVTVNPRPINIGTTSQTICSGTASSVSLTANTTGGTNTFVFTTSSVTGLSGNANGIGSSIAQTLSTTNTSPTNAVYLVTPTFTYNSVACVGTASNYTVTVNPRPVYTGTTSQTICSNTTTSLILSANTNGGTNTFAWTSASVPGLSGNLIGVGNTVSQTLINLNLTNSNVIYSIVSTFTNNTVSCNNVINGSATVTINPIPNVYFDDSINFGSSKQVICSGTNFKTTQFKTDYDVNKVRFDWNKTNSTAIQGLTDTGSANIVSAKLYNVLSKPDSALYSIIPKFTYYSITCLGSPIQTKIIVNPIPITSNPFSQNIYCSDTFLNVKPWAISTIKTPPIIGRTDYRWSFTSSPPFTIAGITVTDTNTSIPSNEKISSFNATKDSIVKVTYTIKSAFTYDNKRCFENDTTFVITVNPRPAIPIFTLQDNINPDYVCYNSKYVNYSVNKLTPINSVTNYDYTWFVTPNNLPITQARNANFSLINFQTAAKPTTVEVVNNIRNNFGCISSKSKSVFVRDNEPPREDVQVIRRTTPNGKQQLWCLANDANGFQWGVTYKTTYKDSILEDEVVNIYNLDMSLLTNFYVWVKLNTSNVCSFKYYYATPTDVKELDKSENFKISIYPNPAFHLLNIKSIKNVITSIEIVSYLGDLIFKKQFDEKEKYVEVENINIDNLAKGVYLIKVIDIDGNIATNKFIKN